jgi:hypothetical protein
MRKLALGIGGILGFAAVALGDIPPPPLTPSVKVERIEREANNLHIYTNGGHFVFSKGATADMCEKFAVIAMTADKKFVLKGTPVKPEACGISEK